MVEAPIEGATTQSSAQGFNASLSNSIYGNSTKVQPKSIQLLMIIKS